MNERSRNGYWGVTQPAPPRALTGYGVMLSRCHTPGRLVRDNTPLNDMQRRRKACGFECMNMHISLDLQFYLPGPLEATLLEEKADGMSLTHTSPRPAPHCSKCLAGGVPLSSHPGSVIRLTNGMGVCHEALAGIRHRAWEYAISACWWLIHTVAWGH